jgi:hypothetical protein
MKGMDCIKCGKIANPARLKFQGYEIDGWKCKCGERYYDPEQAQRILSLNKLKGEVVEVKLNKTRSNLILRIPKAFEQVLGLKEGKTIRLKILDLKKMEVSAEN